MLQLPGDEVLQGLGHGGHGAGVVGAGQQHLAHCQDVDTSVDTGGRPPLQLSTVRYIYDGDGHDEADLHVGGLLAPPGLGPVDDVIMQQGAGVEHLAHHRHLPLLLGHPGRGHLHSGASNKDFTITE